MSATFTIALPEGAPAPDALSISDRAAPAGYADRVRALCEAASAVLAGAGAVHLSAVPGGQFARRDPALTLNRPTDHPSDPGGPRYHWIPLDEAGLVKAGYLRPEPAPPVSARPVDPADFRRRLAAAGITTDED